jgi:hypothetical protein
MIFDNLNSDNIMIYAVKAYDKPNCIMSEFKDDMKRFNYLKRLFKRYRSFGEVRERLVLNHLVVLCNVFTPEIATRLLFYKLAKEYYVPLKTYLTFLNVMPEKVRGIKGKDIISSDIPLDNTLIKVLREIQ